MCATDVKCGVKSLSCDVVVVVVLFAAASICSERLTVGGLGLTL